MADIRQISIGINFIGDVTGKINSYNYNTHFLNIKDNKNSSLHVPTNLIINKSLFNKIKIYNLDDMRKIFFTPQAIIDLYNKSDETYRSKNREVYTNNIKFLSELLFKKNYHFFLDNKKFLIKNFTIPNLYNNKLNKKYILKEKGSRIKSGYNNKNLEEQLIEKMKNNELRYLNLINKPTPGDTVLINRLEKEATAKAIEKLRKLNLDNEIEKFANEKINEFKKSEDSKNLQITYKYFKNKGIKEIIDYNISDIDIQLQLIYEKNKSKLTRRITIKRGNCKTKKQYIKNLWKDIKKGKKPDKIEKFIYSKNKLYILPPNYNKTVKKDIDKLTAQITNRTFGNVPLSQQQQQ